MASKKCAACTKTVYPVEQVSAAGVFFHKNCFRCQHQGCGTPLNLKNFKAHQNKVYCAVHYPEDHQKVKATQVTDSLSTKHAVNAPKKTSEGLSQVHKGDERFRKEGGDFKVEYNQDNAYSTSGNESEGTTTHVESGEGEQYAEGGEGEGEYAEGEYAEGEYAEGEGEGEY
eukprot:TRINITY_DN128_c0_g1_i1.p1 TRINITY_DN128_c0_g1~~TRINITY_DN128_c0_g1_i1.p1  ORF type:complete len:171 (+),score=55.22 TRINITY_DN128_c0_g1_i1:66-578(+)